MEEVKSLAGRGHPADSNRENYIKGTDPFPTCNLITQSPSF